MAEVNPYQKPETSEGPAREKRVFSAETAGVPGESLRVMLGLVVILGVTLGFVVGSGVIAGIDRIKPFSWFLWTATVAVALMGVFVIGAAALGWLSWRLQKMGYPRRRLTVFAGAGWAAGLLCLLAIVRSDRAGEERMADTACGPLRSPPSTGDPAEKCREDFLRCRRALRRQPSYSRLTADAERAMMNECMGHSAGAMR